jgi:hypothetical protein
LLSIITAPFAEIRSGLFTKSCGYSDKEKLNGDVLVEFNKIWDFI